MIELDLRPFAAFKQSAQAKLDIALQLQEAIERAAAEGRTHDLARLEALADEMRPALHDLARETSQVHQNLLKATVDAANTAVLGEIKRLQARKGRHTKRSWRR